MSQYIEGNNICCGALWRVIFTDTVPKRNMEAREGKGREGREGKVMGSVLLRGSNKTDRLSPPFFEIKFLSGKTREQKM
jgi:hypothetical protein